MLGEYDERLTAMLASMAATTASMDAHIRADAVAFAGLIAQLTEVNNDVKSIIASRNFAAGVWKAVSIIGGALVAIATIYLMWKGIYH